MVYPFKRRRLKKQHILWVILLLAALFWQYYLLLGPSSRFGMAKQLRERYGRDFVILSSEKASGDRLGYCIFSAQTFVAAPRDDRDFRFYASSYLASDGFWPVLHRYYNDTYVENQLLCIWERDAQAAGLDYKVSRNRYPLSGQRETFCSGFRVNIDVTPDNLDQVCALLSASMERMLAETPAEQGNMLSFVFNLRYREDSWAENDSNLTTLNLFHNLYHADSAFEWRDVDTNPEAIRQYILDEATRYASRKYPES